MKQYRKSEMKQYKYFPHIGLTLSTASNNENNSTILTGHRLTSKQVDKLKKKTSLGTGKAYTVKEEIEG